MASKIKVSIKKKDGPKEPPVSAKVATIPVKIAAKAGNVEGQGMSPQPLPGPVNVKTLDIPADLKFQYIVHLSDIHIPISLHISRKDEYNAVFDNLYTYLRQLDHLDETLIVITGDLVNTKLRTENETLVMAQAFLTALSNITHTIVMVGNHDFAENNIDRLDSISAICYSLPRIHVLRDTGVYRVGMDVFVFSSLLDKQFIRYNELPDDLRAGPVYALYHGSLVGSSMDNGLPVAHNKTKFYPTAKDFEGYSAVLLGHIHLRQFPKPHMGYAGSLVQQKLNEHPTDHGLILWDASSFRGKVVDIYNPYAQLIVSIKDGVVCLESQVWLDRLADRKLTLRLDFKATTPDQLQDLQTTLRRTYQVVNMTVRDVNKYRFSRREVSADGGNESAGSESGLQADLKLIAQQAKPELVEGVTDLHVGFHRAWDSRKQKQNVYNWKPEKMEFCNLFIYGNSHVNTVVFKDGIIDLCAPNASGKSSIVNILLLVLFNGGIKDKCDILHKGATNGYVSLDLIADGKMYNITKKFDTKGEKVTGKTSFTMVDADGATINLNGTTETATLKLIQDLVGSREQFLSSNTICNRLTCTSILAMTPSELAKHMQLVFGLSHYDDFYCAANDIYKGNKKEIERLESSTSASVELPDLETLDREIEADSASILSIETSLKQQRKDRDHYMLLSNRIQQRLEELNAVIDYDCDDVETQIQQLTELLDTMPADIIAKVENYSLSAIDEQLTAIDGKLRSANTIKRQMAEVQSKVGPTNLDRDQLLEEQSSLRVREKAICKSYQMTEDVAGDEAGDEAGDVAGDVAENVAEDQLMARVDDLRTQIAIARSRVTTDLEIHEIEKACSVLDPSDEMDLLMEERSGLSLQVSMLETEIKNSKTSMGKLVPEWGQDELELPDRYPIDVVSGTQEVESLKNKLRLRSITEHSSEIQVYTFNDEQWVKYSDHLRFSETEYYRSLEQQMHTLQEQLEHNKKCGQIEGHNKAVVYRKAMKDLKECKNRLAIVSSKLDAMQLRDQMDVKRTIQCLKNSLGIHIRKLHQIWSHEKDTINARLHSLSTMIKNYDNYQSLSRKLQTIGNIDELQLLRHVWNDCHRAASTTERLKALEISRDAMNESHAINEELTEHLTRLKEIEAAISELERDRIHTVQHMQDRKAARKIVQQTIVNKTKLVELYGKEVLYSEYLRLFGKNGIPATLLEQRLVQLSETVNAIFFKYTGKYHFKCILDKSENRGTYNIRLVVQNTQHSQLDFNRLSGYESVLLNIALNKALNDLDTQFKAGIFIIDESLDCIDQERFQTCLPDIFELLKQNYASVLVISHRDVPSHLVDHNIDIVRYSNYSRVR